MIGSRGLADSNVLVHQPWYRELTGKTFNVLIRAITRLPWRDTQCGFKLFRVASTRQLFELQRVDGFAFDVELLVLARRLGLEVRRCRSDGSTTRIPTSGSSARRHDMAFDTLRIAYRWRERSALTFSRTRESRHTPLPTKPRRPG